MSMWSNASLMGCEWRRLAASAVIAMSVIAAPLGASADEPRPLTPGERCAAGAATGAAGGAIVSGMSEGGEPGLAALIGGIVGCFGALIQPDIDDAVREISE